MRIKNLSILFVLLTFKLTAQNATFSPYSAIGFGERGNIENSVFGGIGNATLTYFDSTILNIYNPSSYNRLANGTPLFSVGVSSRLSFYEQNNLSSFRSPVYIEQFAFGFSFLNYIGFSVGLKPFSRKGYEIVDYDLAGIDTLKNIYKGSSGSNEVFLGFSTYVLKYTNFKWSVGSNIGYVFGFSNNLRSSILTTSGSSVGGIDQESIIIKSFHYELATSMDYHFKEKHTLGISGFIEPSQELSSSRDYHLFVGKVEDPNSYDTLYREEGEKGQFQLAPTFALGINYILDFNDFRKNRTARNSQLAFHCNYFSTNWGDFRSSFGDEGILLNTSKLSFGIVYTPERKGFENAGNSKFIERVHYRVGAYRYNLPYSVGGAQFEDLGTTFGIGVPIGGKGVQQSLSSVNLSFALGRRSASNASSLKENYIGINFGVVFSPARNEKWFRKLKLD